MSDLGKPYIQVFEVFNQYLTRVTRDMNYYGTCFRSRVISLIPNGKNRTLVGVEMEGSYPYIINKWEEFFV